MAGIMLLVLMLARYAPPTWGMKLDPLGAAAHLVGSIHRQPSSRACATWTPKNADLLSCNKGCQLLKSAGLWTQLGRVALLRGRPCRLWPGHVGSIITFMRQSRLWSATLTDNTHDGCTRLVNKKGEQVHMFDLHFLGHHRLGSNMNTQKCC